MRLPGVLAGGAALILMQYRPLDLAHKVVGVGSVGTRCAIVLGLGGSEGDDPLFMQIKEAGPRCSSSTWGQVPFPTTGSGWWLDSA